jgi:acyl-coenzyme A synthetase/AMP-(fatty) acid ligase
MSSAFPLFRCASASNERHIVAYRQGVPVTARAFLRDVHAVAKHLPPCTHVLNICTDRYFIAVLLSAAMMRGVQSLLPPNAAPETLRALVARYERDQAGGAVCVVADQRDAPPIAAIMNINSLLEARSDEIENSTTPTFDAESVAGILFTSGSTGEPTANPRQWGALCRGVHAEHVALGLEHLGARGPIAIVGTVPAQHSYGLESTIALALQNGHAIVADQCFYPADVAAALARVPQPRVLVTTPFHLRVFAASAENFPAVDLIVSATAPLSPQLAAEAESRFDAPVREIYGCTEAGQVASRRPTEGDLWTLFPDVTLEQRDDAMWVGGGHVGSPRPLNDVIELRSPTTFRLHGRTGDMLNIVGKRSSLAHLDFQLNSIRGVVDGAFVAPMDASDEVVPRMSALVVAPTLTAEQVTQALRERIDPVFLPRPVLLVERLPRNATGKLSQPELRAFVAERRACA